MQSFLKRLVDKWHQSTLRAAQKRADVERDWMFAFRCRFLVPCDYCGTKALPDSRVEAFPGVRRRYSVRMKYIAPDTLELLRSFYTRAETFRCKKHFQQPTQEDPSHR